MDRHTRFSVCFARSLTAKRAMMGMLSAAVLGLPLLAKTSSSFFDMGRIEETGRRIVLEAIEQAS